MKAHERFLTYTTYATESREESPTNPSSKEQFVLANALAEEMKGLGLENVRVDEFCYVYGVLPATPGYEKKPAIGFIAHMDTVENYGQKPTKARLIPHYDGKAVKLGDSGLVLDPAVFPDLPTHAGKTLIVTDGTTPLGADDKAGIAEIMTAVETIIERKIPHGKLCVGFTPDEEIGRGASHFDVPGFGADFAYTVDSGMIGLLEYENFNASKVLVTIRGRNVHPGDAKNKMKNAVLIANEFISMLPAAETPAHTEGYEGFFHVRYLNATESEAKMQIIVRDHSFTKFEAREATIRMIEKVLREKYGEETVTAEIVEQYRNMEEKVRPHMHLIENAKKAMKLNGVEPVVVPIRGGTDGATLSYMGLPCPNMCAGGFAMHGPYEHATCEDIDKIAEIVVSIAKLYAEN
ncbi:MAG: peptidase T [Firmicutes bacterium]|nr:peptidase T [Bacillota bacterium]